MSSAMAEGRSVTSKAAAREVIDRLPENATLHEIVEELRILAALEESVREIEEGQGIPQVEAIKRTREWLSK
jgi:hypothetical protein